MNKVFVNNKPLLFSSEKSDDKKTIPYQNVADFYQAITMLQENNKDITIYHPNIDEVWKIFVEEFKNIYAAGGVVFNENEEMLWIYRLGKWDLPKGKMEKGEKKKATALREVEEECGISNLEISKKLSTTYHMYFHKKWILKITYWYEMKYTGNESLIPQEEEGITQVKWITSQEMNTVLDNTYENIKDLLSKHY